MRREKNRKERGEKNTKKEKDIGAAKRERRETGDRREKESKEKELFGRENEKEREIDLERKRKRRQEREQVESNRKAVVREREWAQFYQFVCMSGGLNFPGVAHVSNDFLQ
jgi:hypothetical protein